MDMNLDYAPKKYCSTADMTVEQWEDARRDSLGGSDMATILGLSPYGNTKRSVWYDKMGITPKVAIPTSQEIIFNSGHFLENMVALLFSYRTGYVPFEVKAMFEHPLHPMLRGNIDRFYRLPTGTAPVGILECKSSSEFKKTDWKDDKIPIQYMIQISTYLSILNMDKCHIACLFIPDTLRWVAGILYQMRSIFGMLPQKTVRDVTDQLEAIGTVEPYAPVLTSLLCDGAMNIPHSILSDCSDAIGDNLVIREFQRDLELEQMIIEGAEDFWNTYVIPKVEPPLDDEKGSAAIETLKRYSEFKEVAHPVILPNNEKLSEAWAKISELQDRKKSLDKKSKDIAEAIDTLSVPFIEALAETKADTGEFVDADDQTHIATFQPGKTRRSIPSKNLPKLKALYPEIYNEYVVESRSDSKIKIK